LEEEDTNKVKVNVVVQSIYAALFKDELKKSRVTYSNGSREKEGSPKIRK
jgi:hypothetical protein